MGFLRSVVSSSLGAVLGFLIYGMIVEAIEQRQGHQVSKRYG